MQICLYAHTLYEGCLAGTLDVAYALYMTKPAFYVLYPCICLGNCAGGTVSEHLSTVERQTLFWLKPT